MNTPAPAPTAPAAPAITKKLARNGYYQVFANGQLIGHVYLKPHKMKGWLARTRTGSTVTQHSKRDDAIAWVVAELKK